MLSKFLKSLKASNKLKKHLNEGSNSFGIRNFFWGFYNKNLFLGTS